MKATCMKKREYYKKWPPIPLPSEECTEEKAPKKFKDDREDVEPFPVYKGDAQSLSFVSNAQNTLAIQQQQQQQENSLAIEPRFPKVREEGKRNLRRAHLLKSLITRLKNARPHAMHWYTFVKRPTEARSRYPLTETLKGYGKVMAKSYPEFEAVLKLYHDEDWSQISEDVFEIPYMPPYEADFIQLKPPVLIPSFPKARPYDEFVPFNFTLPPLIQLTNQVSSEPFVTHFQSVIPLPFEQHRVVMTNPVFVNARDNVISLFNSNNPIEIN